MKYEENDSSKKLMVHIYASLGFNEVTVYFAELLLKEECVLPNDTSDALAVNVLVLRNCGDNFNSINIALVTGKISVT